MSSRCVHFISSYLSRNLTPCLGLLQGKSLGQFKAHERAILWTSHHPKEQQMVTASADGTVKVWKK